MRHHQGTVYLYCFDRPYRHARHYLGWTRDMDARDAEHRAGTGARLLAVIREAGIGFRLVRVWEGDRALERRLKKHHKSARLCPCCNQKIGERFRKENGVST